MAYGDTIRKPGYMGRAFVAWLIYNIVLIIMLAAIVFVISKLGLADQWYILIPLMIGVIISEWIIMAETITPVVREWIEQKEFVKEGEKPSWEKDQR